MEVKPGYKSTEVGVIPEDWGVESLLDMSQKIMDYRGRTPRKLGMNWGGGDIPALSAGNVKKGFIDFSAECYVGSDELYQRWMTQGSTEKGDVLFTTEAPLGNAALVPDDRKYILSQRTILIRGAQGKVLNEYIFYVLISEDFQRILFEYSSGSTAKGIQRRNFEKIQVALPKIEEQREIINALSDIDALLEVLDLLIAKKRAIKKAAMQQLLTGQTRLPGFSGKWEVKKLGALAVISKGEQLHIDEVGTDGQFPHFNGGISPSGFANKFNTPANTIAISEGGNSCGYVQLVSLPFWCGGHCYAVVPQSEDNRFLFHALKNQQQAIHGLRVGSGLPNIQKKSLGSFEVDLPREKSEQVAIATILSDMDAEITALEARRTKTHALKQAVMQELLTGRTRLV